MSKNKCPVCGRTFKSKPAVYGHMKAHGGAKQVAKAPTAEPTEKLTEGTADEPAPTGDLSGFYPPLDTWKADTEQEGADDADATGEIPGDAPSKPGAPTPAKFDTSGIWRAIGDFVDGSILKDKPTKISMTEAKAKMLNESLMALGFMVEAPKEPIVVGYWMPFTLTVASVFIIPIILSVAPDLFKKLPFFGKKKKESEPEPEDYESEAQPEQDIDKAETGLEV